MHREIPIHFSLNSQIIANTKFNSYVRRLRISKAIRLDYDTQLGVDFLRFITIMTIYGFDINNYTLVPGLRVLLSSIVVVLLLATPSLHLLINPLPAVEFSFVKVTS